MYNNIMSAVKLINIGFSQTIEGDRIISMVSPDSAATKRLIANAKKENRLEDATFGRRARCVIVLDDGSVILSAFAPDTTAERVVGDQ